MSDTHATKPALEASAARIREAIEARGLTKVQVAVALGMDDKYGSSVSNWANAKHAPSPIYREKLAEVLGLTVADLIPEGWDARQGSGWMRNGGLRRPRAMGAALEAKRQRDRDYRARQREKSDGYVIGPAETALETYGSNHQAMRSTAKAMLDNLPKTEEVLATSLRSDGTMRIKLDVVLPAARGITLVQLLHEEISTGGGG
jgi:transcriptional regulator with XRE-family HTH domain